MTKHSRRTVYVLSFVVVFAGMSVTAGQMRYWSGQNVVPVFEGWERNPDGSFDMVLGYYNRNVEEALDIPTGPSNNIEPGGPDQGQPTFFAPNRHKYVFRVKVPKDWGTTKRLVWTLTSHGKTETANAFLLPEWESNNQVMAQNSDGGGGAGGSSGYISPPTITMGPSQVIALPGTANLTASITNSAPPRPSSERQRSARPGAQRGPQLRVDWLEYRGPVGGRVTFTPKSSPVIDGKAFTTATFSAPGQYLVRGFANNGSLTTPADVTLTVNPASSAEVAR
jgi:hypothetical protein